jgi:hypothetical protein
MVAAMRVAMLAGGALIGLASVGPARADAPATVHLVGDATGCPSPEAVAQEARGLLVRTRVAVGDAPEGRLEIIDLGAQYRVVGLGLERQLSDAARRCDERARSVALYLALALEAPFAPESSAPSAPRAAPPRAGWRRLAADLEAGAWLDATAEAGGAVSGGGVVRASLGVAPLRATLGAGALSPVVLTFARGAGQFTRIPLDVGLRGVYRRGRVELSADLGFAATVLLSEGVNLPVRTHSVRLDAGIRAAATVRVWLKERIAPFVTLQTTVSAKPIDVVLDPVGRVGTTPEWWLGAILGAAVRLH